MKKIVYFNFMDCIAYCISWENMDLIGLDCMGKTFSLYINYWGHLVVGKCPPF
jgi:hypothetical protein